MLSEILTCGECVLFSQTTETRILNRFLCDENAPLTDEIREITGRYHIVAEKMRESRNAFIDNEFFIGIRGCMFPRMRHGLSLSVCSSEEEYFSLRSIGLDTL
jgi:hypothetical protein